MSVVVINNLPLFGNIAKKTLDDALGSAARDTQVDAKAHAPFQKGALRSYSDNNRQGNLHWRVSFDMEYAAYQERGARRDGSHRVRKYSTSGTGAHFLENAGDKQILKLPGKFKMYAQRAKV
jgi:hypothetical protein